jgi:hypothetical protein
VAECVAVAAEFSAYGRQEESHVRHGLVFSFYRPVNRGRSSDARPVHQFDQIAAR